MTVIHRFRQSIGDASADADHRRLLDAEPEGDRVGGLEADAADIARQAIRVVGHDLDGIGAVGFVDPHRTGRADAVAVQEHHDLAPDLLLGPGRGDTPGADGPDAIDLAHPVRLGLDDVKPNFRTVTVSTAGNQQNSAVLRERDPIVVLNLPVPP